MRNWLPFEDEITVEVERETMEQMVGSRRAGPDRPTLNIRPPSESDGVPRVTGQEDTAPAVIVG